MFWVVVCCVTMLESTFLTHASPARLGENSRDSDHVAARASRSGGVTWFWATDQLA